MKNMYVLSDFLGWAGIGLVSGFGTHFIFSLLGTVIRKVFQQFE